MREEKVAVLKGLKESVAGNVFSCACDVEDGLSRDTEKDGTIRKSGDGVPFCSS